MMGISVFWNMKIMRINWIILQNMMVRIINGHFQKPSDWRWLPSMRPKFQGLSPQDMVENMVLTHLYFRIPEFPLKLELGAGRL